MKRGVIYHLSSFILYGFLYRLVQPMCRVFLDIAGIWYLLLLDFVPNSTLQQLLVLLLSLVWH